MKFLIALIVCVAVFQVQRVDGHNVEMDPKGMVEIEGHTYYFSLDGVTSTAAQASTFCSEVGMKLLVPDTLSKNTAIKNYLRTEGLNSGYWTGGRGAVRWVWEDSSGFSFTDWSVGQPNNDWCEVTLCVFIDMFGWGDYACGATYGWICE